MIYHTAHMNMGRLAHSQRSRPTASASSPRHGMLFDASRRFGQNVAALRFFAAIFAGIGLLGAILLAAIRRRRAKPRDARGRAPLTCDAHAVIGILMMIARRIAAECARYVIGFALGSAMLADNLSRACDVAFTPLSPRYRNI